MYLEIRFNEDLELISVEPVEKEDFIKVLASTEKGHTTYIILDFDTNYFKNMDSEDMICYLDSDGSSIAKFFNE